MQDLSWCSTHMGRSQGDYINSSHCQLPALLHAMPRNSLCLQAADVTRALAASDSTRWAALSPGVFIFSSTTLLIVLKRAVIACTEYPYE